jgi:hypothetical protein
VRSEGTVPAAIGAVLCLAASMGSARAQPADSTLTGRAIETPPPKLAVTRTKEASSCPDAAELNTRLEQLLGRSPAVDTNEGLGEGFDVEMSKDAEGFVAVIRPRAQPAAERRLSDPGATCEGLAEALGLTLGLLLDREQPRTAEGPGPGDTAPPPRAAAAGERRHAPPAGVRAGALGLGIDAGVLATYELLDSAWPALFAEVELRAFERLGIAAGALWMPTEPLEAGATTVDVGLLAATARGCWYLRVATPRIGACALGGVGRLQAQGQGFDVTYARTSPWYAVGAAGIAGGPLFGPIGWSARVGVWVPLRHETLHDCTTDSAGSNACKDVDSAQDANATLGTRYETAPLAPLVGGGLHASIF